MSDGEFNQRVAEFLTMLGQCMLVRRKSDNQLYQIAEFTSDGLLRLVEPSRDASMERRPGQVCVPPSEVERV